MGGFLQPVFAKCLQADMGSCSTSESTFFYNNFQQNCRWMQLYCQKFSKSSFFWNFCKEKRFFLKYLKLIKGGSFFLERVLKGVFSRNNLFVQNFSFCG